MSPGSITADRAAITLSAIAVRTEEECAMTFGAETNSQPQNDFAMNRHAYSAGGLDNDSLSVAG